MLLWFTPQSLVWKKLQQSTREVSKIFLNERGPSIALKKVQNQKELITHEITIKHLIWSRAEIGQILTFADFLVVVQLIFRPSRTKISCKTTRNLPNFSLWPSPGQGPMCTVCGPTSQQVNPSTDVTVRICPSFSSGLYVCLCLAHCCPLGPHVDAGDVQSLHRGLPVFSSDLAIGRNR